MSPNQGVFVGDGLTPHHTPAALAKLRLFMSGMDSLETMQTFLQGWRQTVVCFDLIHECSVTAHLGSVEDVQEGGARRLLFISHIRVPSHTAVSVGKEGLYLSLMAISMDQVDLRMTLRRPAGWMNVVAAKVSPKVQCILNWKVGKILVAESDNLPLGNKQGELVLASRSKLAELNAGYFRAGGWSKLFDDRTFDQEVFEGRVRAHPILSVDERLKRWVLFAMVPDWKIVWVL